MIRTGLTIFLCLGIIAIAVWSCEDNTINNYHLSEEGSLQGRIIPADSGEVVLSGTADLTLPIAADGNFYKDQIQPGYYDITVFPANHSKRIFEDRLIAAGSGLNLGTIPTNNLPWPILSITPSDNAKDIELATTFVIQSYASLDLTSLETGATFDPPLEGIWREVVSSGGFNYYFGLPYGSGSQTRIRLLPGASYTLNIDKSVINAAGGSATADLRSTFSAQPLQVTLVTTPTPGNPVSLNSFHLDLIFNTCVSEDAVNQAVSINPPIDGYWLGDRVCQDNPYEVPDGFGEFRFFPFVNSLPPSTAYLVTISGNVDFVEEISLPHDTTLSFDTEPPRIVYSSPTTGSLVSYLSVIEIDFNTPMDSASVAEAFTLQVLDEEPLAGTYRWYSNYTSLQFDPDDPFRIGNVYVFRVSTGALSADGIAIESGIESYFRMR